MQPFSIVSPSTNRHCTVQLCANILTYKDHVGGLCRSKNKRQGPKHMEKTVSSSHGRHHSTVLRGLTLPFPSLKVAAI